MSGNKPPSPLPSVQEQQQQQQAHCQQAQQQQQQSPLLRHLQREPRYLIRNATILSQVIIGIQRPTCYFLQKSTGQIISKTCTVYSQSTHLSSGLSLEFTDQGFQSRFISFNPNGRKQFFDVVRAGAFVATSLKKEISSNVTHLRKCQRSQPSAENWDISLLLILDDFQRVKYR